MNNVLNNVGNVKDKDINGNINATLKDKNEKKNSDESITPRVTTNRSN